MVKIVDNIIKRVTRKKKVVEPEAIAEANRIVIVEKVVPFNGDGNELSQENIQRKANRK